MNAVLRVALTTFTIVPLQRVLNFFGLALFVVGAAFYVSADSPNNARALFAFMLVGVVILLITPAFAGGVALRFASTRSVLHLQPHGRLRMLLGMTLAITIMALLMSMPWAFLEWQAAFDGCALPARHVASRDVFLVAWAAIALLWIGIFVFSRSALTMAFVGVVPVFILGFGERLEALIPGPGGVLALGLTCWAAFALWYLRTAQVKRPDFPLGGDASMQPEANPVGRLMAWLDVRNPATPTRDEAVRLLLLGSPSYSMHALTGIWVGALFVAMQLVTAGLTVRNPASFVVVMPFLAFFGAGAGYTIGRRSRYLWLRTAHDRAALFAAAESMGLRATMAAWLAAALILGTLASRGLAMQLPAMILFFGLQALVTVLVFYGGLAMVRGWSAGEVLMCVGLAVLTVGPLTLFGPGGGLSARTLGWTLPPMLLAIRLMRAFAAHRWRSLDWRVARLPRMTRT